ncbi:MAG TPA: hypothetical protein VMW54_01270 [Terriglobia bacterium]|nr:hypothetical protein [Terriglobia bacterium]
MRSKIAFSALVSAIAILFTFFINLPGLKSQQSPESRVKISIQVNRTEIGEGQNVVVSAMALRQGDGKPAAGIDLFAKVNGKEWGAKYRTLKSGVAHLLLPLPEVGDNSIVVTDGTDLSAPVTVHVHARHFNIITDPNHLLIMEYEVWFGPGYAQWGKEEAVPLLGLYSSLDPRVLRQQNLWFNEMGINVVELDWTNNLTAPFPDAPARECIAGTDALLHVYEKMAQHPKFVFMLGPEHNHWSSRKDQYTGPWYDAQLNYLYQHYIHNKKYRDWYLTYEGKPLLLLYLTGPTRSEPPAIKDSRFTIRYVTAWLQTTHGERYGAWSWYDQRATPTLHNGKVEALTVTNGYPAIHPPAKGLNNWLAADAGGKNYGETYRTQWQVAMKAHPQFLFINQWNEFEPPDQYNVNLSNDMEPTLMTELGDPRPSGWGFYYMDLTRDMIRAYHRAIAGKQP